MTQRPIQVPLLLIILIAVKLFALLIHNLVLFLTMSKTFANPQETTMPTKNLLYLLASVRELITAKYCLPQTTKEIQVQELLIQGKLLLHHTVKVMLRFLVQIMNIGNNMYSALSQSAKQGLLLLTDLPCMVNLCDTNYQLTYSESYSGWINSFALPIIADFPYVASLSAALILIVWLCIIIMHLF